MPEKSNFAYQLETVMTALAGDLQRARDLVRIYNVRTYGPNAANAITTTDLQSPVKGTADDLYSAIIYLDQLTQAEAANTYRPVVDKLRQDY